MDDSQIVELYWQRSDRAIPETAAKYGAYCRRIACNILQSPEDAEECVNDVWLRAWNAMPEQRPARLDAFLGRLTRWLSLDRRRREGRGRRGGGEYTLALEELDGCLAVPESVESRVETAELSAAIDRFLAGLAPDERTVFLARYYFGCPIRLIAEKHGFGESKVKTMLHRTRKKLQNALREEGYL
jgi:RNA polymerase sigma factor, sigma-70 family